MSWLISTILAYAVIAITNITDKLLVDKYIKDSSIVVIFSGTIAAAVGLVMLFFLGIPTYSTIEFARIIVAGILLQYYMLPYFSALNTDDPSLVVPLFQAIPIFTLLLSWLFLGENLYTPQLVGFVLILLGGILVSVSGKGSFRLRRSFWLMMGSSLLFSLSSILFKGVVDESNLWQTIALESVGIGAGTLLLLLLPNFKKRTYKAIRKMPSAGWKALGISEVFYVLYRFLILTAFSLGSVVIVSVLSGIQSVFVLIYGVILTTVNPQLYREDLRRFVLLRKAIACLLIFAGLYFVYR